MSGHIARESRRSKIEGVSYEVSGPEGAPVVLFGHSLLFDGRMWEVQVDDLARDHRCIVIDFRGHGQSDEPAAGYRMADHAEDYRRVLDAEAVTSATIVGLSMGGMAAMAFALAHPSRVSALVLMDTSADVEPAGPRAKNQALAVTARLFGIGSFIARQVEPIMWSARFRVDGKDTVALWTQRTMALPKRGTFRAVMSVMRRPSLVSRLADLRVPTLVIVGDEDVATPPSKARQIADLIEGAELRTLPRTGHISNIEEPELVTKLLRTFLARLG